MPYRLTHSRLPERSVLGVEEVVVPAFGSGHGEGDRDFLPVVCRVLGELHRASWTAILRVLAWSAVHTENALRFDPVESGVLLDPLLEYCPHLVRGWVHQRW